MTINMKKLMERLEEIGETDEFSPGAVDTSTSGDLYRDLLITYNHYKNDEDFDGWYLLEDVERLLQKYRKDQT